MRADDITSKYYMPMQVYAPARAMYFVMAFPLSLCARWLERALGRGRARARQA